MRLASAETPSETSGGLDVHRVAEIIVSSSSDGEPRRWRGSGYLVAVGRVLTADHVVAGARVVQVRFDADLPTERVCRAEIVWEDAAIDVAVLAVEGDWHRIGWADFGRVPERDMQLRCSSVGFPAFKMRRGAESTLYRDSCHVHGTCAVWSNRREGTLDLRVGASPAAKQAGRSPWEGMSGAAVFSGERIIGIVGRHHLSDGHDHLAVLRADRWHGRLPAEKARSLEDSIGVPLVPGRLGSVWREPDRVAGAETRPPLGKPVQSLPPEHALALEVHPAIQVRDPDERLDILPPYLQRPDVDDRLRAVVADAENGSRLVMLVGGSSTGKTRAAWEAVRSCLSDGWLLWHPLTPDRPASVLEALRSGRIAQRTIVWLNEAQLYLGPRAHGEQVAAALQELLAGDRAGPLLVLGSLWPAYWQELTAEPERGAADPHAAARSLLDMATEIHVPDRFDENDLDCHRKLLDTDPRLALAAASTDGRINQFLAGAPELIRRYQQAPTPARAVLWAAMDALRLGHGPRLPRLFLEEAAPGYLSDDEWDALDDAWFEQALTYLAEPCRGARGPLVRIRPRPGSPKERTTTYRLADYLEQHGRAERWQLSPPAGFWTAAIRAATPQDIRQLAEAAWERWRLQHAALLYAQAAGQGDEQALEGMNRLHRHIGWPPGAESRADGLDGACTGTVTLADARWAMRQPSLRALMDAQEEVGEPQRSAESVALWGRPEANDARLWREMEPLREAAPDMRATEDLLAEAVAGGHTRLLFSMSLIRELAGDPDGAERHLRQAVRAGHARALSDLGRLRELAGDHEAANCYALEAAGKGDTRFLLALVAQREQPDATSSQRLAHRAADAGQAGVLVSWLVRRVWAEGIRSPWVWLWRYGLTAEGNISAPW
ncbi:trypsin-like peptidase domain-containing protein [Streptomyces malaysiensis]|uniref:trypsin-like peptidase domain-containing protein n=1 Tax=Streptomyces malaysiensis TaxID=92644 RepID=UPI0036A2F085